MTHTIEPVVARNESDIIELFGFGSVAHLMWLGWAKCPAFAAKPPVVLRVRDSSDSKHDPA